VKPQRETSLEPAASSPQPPPAYVLGNGRYAVLVTRSGAGYSACAGCALTRWTPDPIRQTRGFFVLVRDIERNDTWSAGFEPLARRPQRYAMQAVDGRIDITRLDDGIETKLEICVVPDADVELRRVTLANHDSVACHLEITTYLEVVLNDLRADAAHPVFSKLFIQTMWLPELESLLARRRPRSADEAPLWLVHRLMGGESDVSFETDRLRFLGRGRSPANPAALEPGVALSGTVGDVLDPVLSLRRRIRLVPGESASVTAVLGAASSLAAAAALVSRFGPTSRVDAAFAAARDAQGSVAVTRGGSHDADPMIREALALPASWEHAIDVPPIPCSRPAQRGAPFQRATADAGDALAWSHEQLQYFNGTGGFSEDGHEYVIRLDPSDAALHPPPVPWSNVIANERVGFITTESGAGHTWAGNSRRYRLTPWSNDPVTDPPGEALFIRDEDAGIFWSPLPVAPVTGRYEVRHGIGYSRYLHRSGGLDQDVRVFVPREDPVKIALMTLHNASERVRRLTVFAYARWVLGAKAQETAQTVLTRRDDAQAMILAENPGAAFAGVAFAALTGAARATADRAAFLGAFGTLSAPAAVTAGRPLTEQTGPGLDPCAAFEAPIELRPGETLSLSFLLGHAHDDAAASALVAKYSDPETATQALEHVRVCWQDLVAGLQITTPVPAIDLMVNGWLAYQTLSCRIHGRSAFYQSGGAFGFRDQLQDAAALVFIAPELTRAQILLHAAHQFREGDVLHWWHPPDGLGIRTRFSDDLLWLPYIAAFYVRATGDHSLFNENVRFITGRTVPEGDDEVSLVPEDAGESGSVYEHCCRAIDRSLTRGAHGLPLIGSGDWNDGMNRVGREGRGESVWLGFFLYDILDDFIPICEARGDGTRASHYRDYRTALARALDLSGWDGQWYRRAYYDDGTPIGSATSDECRIDAIAQAWAVMSGVASSERAACALDALEEHLVDEEGGLIRLLDPPFDRTPHDPGYIKGYLPGVRENGGQYTHGALWVVRALAEAGRTDRAARLLEMLSPVSHATTPAGVAVYRAEPYVIAADVYGAPPHVGRAGWSWYTGSSGWMLRVAIESLLGFELDHGRAIRLRPRLPADWPGYRIRYRVPGTGTRYDIEVRRSAAPSDSRVRATVEGSVDLRVEGDIVVIGLEADGRPHAVTVTIHDAVESDIEGSAEG
jgi:cyclic beta-1,2-glucan synthetase